MTRFSAQIPVDPNGYRWVNLENWSPGEGKDEYELSLFLQAVDHDQWLQEFERNRYVVFDQNTYDPFVREPALFRIFAELEPTEVRILEFANKYGDIARFDEIMTQGGQCLAEWKFAIQMMQEAIRLSDQYVTRDAHRANAKAVDSICSLINQLLADLPVYYGAIWQNDGIQLKELAHSLGDVMKLQLVDSIVQRKRYRKCLQCEKPFELTPQVNRSDRVFCSDSCRMKAYYRRKKLALELRANGKTMREIVKTTRSDLATVRGWLQATAPKKSKEA